MTNGNLPGCVRIFECGSFDQAASKLPKAHSPAWTLWVLWLSVIGLVAFFWLSLNASLDEYVLAVGEVRPKDYTIIFSTASGMLKEFLVEDGDDVAEGDVVARVWLLPEQVAIDPQGLKPYEIRSPDAGKVISTTRLFCGERVKMGTPLVKLVRGNQRQIRIYATEDRIDRLEVGQEVRFRARSNPDRLAPPAVGRVLSVARDKDLCPEKGADTSPPVYYVKASVEHADYELPFGAQVDAEIVLGKRRLWQLLFVRLMD